MNFKDFLNELIISKSLPNDDPSKFKEGYYVVDNELLISFGPFELSQKGFKQAKAAAQGNYAGVVKLSQDLSSNKKSWLLVKPDGSSK